MAPLSYAQEGIWFTQLMNPNSPQFNIVTGLGLRADPGRAAVEQALRAVADRHSILRTVFGSPWDPPHQRIHPYERFDVDLVEADLSTAGSPRDAAAEIVKASVATPFDVSAAPPWRAHLLHLNKGEHVIAIVAHHLIADDRSMEIWADELDSLISGRTPESLPELNIKYDDFVSWQREWLDEPEQAELFRYWRHALSGYPSWSGPCPDLPKGAEPSRVARSFPADVETVERVRARAHEAGTTLLAAWATVVGAAVARHTGGDRVLLGCVTTGRTLPELQSLIGCFSNIVVLPIDLGGDPNFLDGLAAGRRALLSALQHEDVPFSRVVELVNPPRGGVRGPIAQVGVQVTERSYPLPGVRGEEVAGVAAGTAAGPFDLEFQLRADDGNAIATVLYRADLYSRDLIEELGAQALGLLDQAAGHPDRPLIPARAAAPYRPAGGEPSTVDGLIAAQAARTPDATAVLYDDLRLSYAELMTRAYAIAAGLRDGGVTAGTPVGVLMERSIDLVPAVLGALAAGGVYIPLDPGYPAPRLRQAVERAGLKVVLGDRTTATVAGRIGVHLLKANGLTGLGPQVDGHDEHDAAYVMFTSGSTGVPKGVVVEHRSAVATMRAMTEEIGLGADDVWLAVTPISFDISVLELLLPLTVGGTVVVAPREATRDGEQLCALARRSGTTVIQATPATWRMILAADDSDGLKVSVLCGGEALAPDLAARLRGFGRGQWNLYGPTETTIWASAWRLHEADGRRVSIGRPLAGAEFLILDSDRTPVPTGSLGELYIGGPCVARGYLDDPATTGERFVWLGTGRHYRTGDLVRRLPDGMYEFVGRNDAQVKVRGFRIELPEVETTLRAHPLVDDAMCTVVRDDSGEHRLVAHLVTAVTETPAPDEFRRFLAERLPPYMVPSSWFVIDAVPLTPNGKVDRGAPGTASRRLGPPSTRPATMSEVEREVARIGAELLRLDALGADEDVFAVGGHSLLIVHLLARLRAHFGVAVPLRALFDRPTVREIAQTIEAHLTMARASEAPKLVRQPRSRPPSSPDRADPATSG
ncbi:non-ribosomal peptide synthetase [Rhizohabitans arisaemae]|uniref:non-ribosomal peptide synthetase n=1 Tax=Rhizohabitans arisaemae TaxID=2720610 RepID=UPI0024B20FF1|nr:amino acid adenylation domain-containing protein [Rhizohabitans arisaemae]